MADILCEEIPNEHGNIGLLTLNRPQALNALNEEIFLALSKYLTQWASDPQIKAVIIQASPGRAFSAGGDIREVYLKLRCDYDSACKFFAIEYSLNYLIRNYPKPYIALMDGITMGGGAGISIHGSHPVASEKLIFAMPETTIGFFTDVGSSYFLSRLPDSIGIYLGLTGETINLHDSLQLGLVKYSIKSENFPALLEELIRIPVTDIYRTLLYYRSIPQQASTLDPKRELIKTIFNKSSIEEIMQALQNNSDEWCQKTLSNLKNKSPTSLKVQLSLLQKGKELDFAQCIQMEYRLVTHFLKSYDFFEGIRAQVIDKDKNPQWQPANLSEISDAQIEEFFTSYEGKELNLPV